MCILSVDREVISFTADIMQLVALYVLMEGTSVCMYSYQATWLCIA